MEKLRPPRALNRRTARLPASDTSRFVDKGWLVMFSVVIAGEEPRQLALLAEQIERHVPDARICGIVYQGSSQFVPLIASIMSLAVGLLSREVLSAIHGRRLMTSEMTGSAERALAKRCREAGWLLHSVENIESDDTKRFLRERNADLAVFAGFAKLPSVDEKLTTHGVVAGQISCTGKQVFKKPFAGSSGAPVQNSQITVTEVTVRGQRLLFSFDLNAEALDTDLSLRLKSNLILRDLLVQSVAAVVQHPQQAQHQVQAWAREMIPSYLWRPRTSEPDSSIDQAPSVRVRAYWKLCVYSLFLVLPTVILRNWFYRWRKRYPVVFLTSHLISDRHHRMGLPTGAFLRVARYLKKHYCIVSFSEACRLLRSGTNDRPTVVLTFDDGYEDNFVNLRAVCEEIGLPVALFVSTDPVTLHREFVHDSSRGLAGFRALTWDQIRYWSAEGVEFHSHTCSHYDCGSTDEVSLRKEMSESKRRLEEQLGKSVTALAFPFG